MCPGRFAPVRLEDPSCLARLCPDSPAVVASPRHHCGCRHEKGLRLVAILTGARRGRLRDRRLMQTRCTTRSANVVHTRLYSPRRAFLPRKPPLRSSSWGNTSPCREEHYSTPLGGRDAHPPRARHGHLHGKSGRWPDAPCRGDSAHPPQSGVLGGLIRKTKEARECTASKKSPRQFGPDRESELLILR